MGDTEKSYNKFQRLAKASLVVPLLAVGLSIFTGQGRIIITRLIIEVTVLVFCLIGFIIGVLALFGIRRYGIKNILIPALSGILINILMLSIWVTNYVVAVLKLNK